MHIIIDQNVFFICGFFFSMAERFCGYCGAKVLPNEKFCPNCGRKIIFTPLDSTIQDNLSKKIEQIELQKNGKIPSAESEPENIPPPNRRTYFFVPENETNFQPIPQMPGIGDSQTYPRIGSRILAYIIDLVIIFFIAQFILPYFIKDIVIPDINGLPEDPNTWTPEQYAIFEQAQSEVLSILSIFSTIMSVVTFIYNFLFHISPAKATLGQMVLKFKLVDADNFGTANFGKILFVDSIKCIDLLLIFDLLLVSINRRPGMYRLSNSLTRITMVKKSYLQGLTENNVMPPF